MDVFYKLVCRALQYTSFKDFCRDWFLFDIEYMKMAWKVAKNEF